MRLFLTVEAQNCTENGLSEILKETMNKGVYIIFLQIGIFLKKNPLFFMNENIKSGQ